MEINERTRKRAASVIAVLLALAVIFAGTFAYRSVRQKALNEDDGYSNPGARLHDDFNGRNKDVYVENFTDPDNGGTPIYARIRLDEYMEIGKGAGKPEAEVRNVRVIGKTDADINDKSTWAPHTMGQDSHADIHKYWTWEMGGKTVFMPTFNKDKDSLAADINGTYAGPDGDRTTDGDKFKDYHEYDLGEEKTDMAIYGIDNQAEETHRGKETLESKVITMAEWKAMGAPIGNYWVYDVDGWAYWAQAIEPGEATGLLTTGIKFNNVPSEEWYYGVNVLGEFATAGDWGEKEGNTGFYEEGITEDGLFLLNHVSGRLSGIVSMQIKGGFKQYVRAGSSLDLEVDINMENSTGSPGETYVTWSCEPSTTALAGNKFAPDDKMVGNTYRVTATSTQYPDVTAFTDIYVYPREAVGVVKGELDGKTYVDFGDNTFKEIKEDGSLGEFVCGGLDEKIGNSDDKFNVVVLDPADPNFGSKFIGPEEGIYYYAMGPDGKLGTADDIRVTGNPWPNDIANAVADDIRITGVNNNATVQRAVEIPLRAVVTLKGEPIENQEVTWGISGNKNANTRISDTGVLIVGAETPNTILTIYASSKILPGLEKSITVKVGPLDYGSLKNVSAGTTTTVRIDGIDWYVLAKSGNKALIWSKNTVGSARLFGNNTNNWKSSSIRTYLNGTLLNQWKVLKEKVVATSITTRSQHNATTWDTTTDKVFLLSEADLSGTINSIKTTNAKDYTYGNTILIQNANIRNSNIGYWLRSPKGNGSIYLLPVISRDGVSGTAQLYDTSGVRPALWVQMPV